MRRQARIDIPEVVHHVMARGIDGCDMFRDDKDREVLDRRKRKITDGA